MSRAFGATQFKRSLRGVRGLLACLHGVRRGECTCIDPRNSSAGLLRTQTRLSSLRLLSSLEYRSAKVFCMVLTIGCTEHLWRLPAVLAVLQCIKNNRAKSPRVWHVAARPMRTTPEGFRPKPDGVQVTREPSSSPSHQQRDPPFRGCPDCVHYAR